MIQLFDWFRAKPSLKSASELSFSRAGRRTTLWQDESDANFYGFAPRQRATRQP